jgi:hypothetical protein
MTTTGTGPGVLDALSLLAHVADELGVRTARDTHTAWVDRVHGLLDASVPASSAPPRGLHRNLHQGLHQGLHRGIAGSVYGGLSLGLRGAARALDRAADLDLDERWDPRLEAGARGRFVRSAVNGLIGDRLEHERPQWCIPMAARVRDVDVPLRADGVGAAYPGASGRLAVFLHGLCENESSWSYGRDERGTTYAEGLAARGWTPVMLRANTGLGLRVNGVALSGVLQSLMEAWPVPVERIALVGHSMGGLVFRAAGDVVSDRPKPWADLVSDVVTLGTPHLGAPIARGIGHGARLLSLLPELAAFGRILDWRSTGVHDLVEGLAEDVPPLPHARYRLVAATLTRSPRHPVGAWAGDLLVRVPSAHGRGPRGRVELFPGADVLHVPAADHFDLLNHERVHAALLDWLG